MSDVIVGLALYELIVVLVAVALFLVGVVWTGWAFLLREWADKRRRPMWRGSDR